MDLLEFILKIFVGLFLLAHLGWLIFFFIRLQYWIKNRKKPQGSIYVECVDDNPFFEIFYLDLIIALILISLTIGNKILS
jgi:hypothetical protein